MNYSFFISDKNTREKTQRDYSLPRFISKDLQITAIEGGIVLPGKKNGLGGVLDKDGYPYPHSSIHRGRQGLYQYDKSEIVEYNEEVVYIGMWGANWGHCLTDNIKHLWFIFYPQYDYLKELKWVWSPIWGDIPETFFKLLEKWGVNTANLIRIEHVCKFKRVYLPDDCFTLTGEYRYTDYKYTKEFAHFYDPTVLPTPDCTGIPIHEKVYYSRSRWLLKKDDGEQHLEEAFRKMGYSILYPESMTLDEQIYTLRNCKYFATTDGSVAHNAVFLQKGANIAIVMKGDYTTGYQETICRMQELDVSMISSHKSVCANYVAPSCGPFFLYCSKDLRDFSGGMDLGPFPWKDFMHYLITKGPHQLKVILRYWYHRLAGK